MSDILSMRDHGQPCGHVLRWRYRLGPQGFWMCMAPGCPGGREVRVDEAMIERGCTELETWFPNEDWDLPPVVAAVLRAALEVTDE
jgi:hypothetical protein